MYKLIATTTLAMGAALMPAAAFCQTQTDAQHIPMEGPKTGSSAEPAAPSIPVEDRATKEQLTRLFEVMRIRQQMESMTKMMPAMIQQQIAAQTKELQAKFPGSGSSTPAQQEELAKLTKKYMEKATSVYPVEEMIDDMTAVYQRHLSRSDVEAFIAFYGSTPGQHLLDEQPAIMEEYLPIVMQRTQEHSKQLTDEMSKDVEEMIKAAGPAADKQ